MKSIICILIFVASSFALVLPSDSMAFFFSFENNANDSMNNVNATIVGPQEYQDGIKGIYDNGTPYSSKGFRFRGSNYITTDFVPNRTTWTMSFWIRYDGTLVDNKPEAETPFFSNWTYDDWGITFMLFNGQNGNMQMLRRGGGNPMYQHILDIPDLDNWNHFMIVNTPDSLKVYHNAQLIYTDYDDMFPLTVDQPFFIGTSPNIEDPRYVNAGQEKFYGMIDDFRFYNGNMWGEYDSFTLWVNGRNSNDVASVKPNFTVREVHSNLSVTKTFDILGRVTNMQKGVQIQEKCKLRIIVQ